MSEPSLSPFGKGEFGSVLDGDPFHSRVSGHHELGDAFTWFDGCLLYTSDAADE